MPDVNTPTDILVQWLRREATIHDTARGIGYLRHHEHAEKLRVAADTIERLERELKELREEHAGIGFERDLNRE